MKIALGPLLYLWPREKALAFYERVRDWPVEIVYLGETVCAKRRELRPEDWQSIAEDLTAAGKDVVMSTLVLLEAGSEVGEMRRLINHGSLLVEANDMSAVGIAAQRGHFVAGPHLNIYNEATLSMMHTWGASRWVAPLELGHQELMLLQEAKPENLETEVFAYGRMPLAFSARCFTARADAVPKDRCHFRCIHDPDGRAVFTQENELVFALNGIQTQSGRVHSLLAQIPKLRDTGIDVVRLSPQSDGMEQVVRLFRQVVDDRRDPSEAEHTLACHAPAPLCNGYWHGTAGMGSLNPSGDQAAQRFQTLG